MNHSRVTVDEIVSMWEMYNSKRINAAGIATRLQRTKPAVQTNISRLKKYLYGKEEAPTSDWRKAIAIIKEEDKQEVAPQATNGVATPAPSNEDAITKLENLFDSFTTQLVDILDQEATRRSEKMVDEKLKVQKDHYEKELQRLQTILVDAQNSSVVGLIRKKWGQ